MTLTSRFRGASSPVSPVGKGMTFHVLNAFTSAQEKTLGNPASICVVDTFPDDAAMGAMAATLGTAMTTFLRKTSDPAVYDIRHFSPDGQENHICGHALVAASEHLARLYPAFRQGQVVTYRANPKYNLNQHNAMSARIEGTKISLTLPAVLDMEEIRDPAFYAETAAALGITVGDIVQPSYFAPRANNYLVVLKDPSVLTSLSPDFNKLNAVSHDPRFSRLQGGETIVPFWCLTSRADGTAYAERYDVLNRVFSPDIGVDEDPACGSANCSIIPYWAMFDPARTLAAKTGDAYRVLYPYPPAPAGMVGGVQNIRLDSAKGEIVLTAQATFDRVVTLDAPMVKTARKARPGHKPARKKP